MTKHSIKEALNDIRAAIAGTDEPTQKSTVKALDAIADAIANGGGAGGGGMVINTTGQFSDTEKHTDKTYAEARQYIDDNNSYDVVLNDSIFGVAQLVAVFGTIRSGELRFARVTFTVNGDLEIAMYYLRSSYSEPTVAFETKTFSPKSA